jgi:uncharacterized protein (TIGR02246 family)
MKKTLIAALAASAVGVAVVGSAAPADDAIKQVFAQLDRCIANNDAKCVGELFAEDATYLAPTTGAKIIKGKAEIVKVLERSLGDPNAKGAKVVHSVENVRMIGADRAIVDSAVAVTGAKPDGAADAAREAYHDVSVMVMKDGTWRCEDVRMYVVGSATPAKK